MTPETQFRIPIEPQSLQFGAKRIRIIPNKHRPGKMLPMHFSDKRADKFKQDVALLCNRFRPATPLEGPIRLLVLFVMRRPKALFRKCDPNGRVWCTARPDSTNLLKGLEDILSGKPKEGVPGFWRDDAQVCWSEPIRCYAGKDEPPCIEVMIWKLPPYAPSLLASLFQ